MVTNIIVHGNSGSSGTGPSSRVAMVTDAISLPTGLTLSKSPISQNGNREDIVTINVGGDRFQTRRSTLQRFPDTLLGSSELEEYFVPETREYFFDRSRSAFEPILYYYQSNGIVCLPSHVNPDVFSEELKFFRLGDQIIDKFRNPAVLRQEQAKLAVKTTIYCHPMQKTLWLMFDDPDSSLVAKVIAYFDLVIILLAVTSQCIESLPEVRREVEGATVWGTAISAESVRTCLTVIEYVSNIWFTVNFIIRVSCCPDKKEFAKGMLNWFDLLAIIPFYLDLILADEDGGNLGFLMVLRFFRTMRVVRIFKMSRYFQGLFALGYALSTSAGELLVLSLMLVTFVVLFSSLIFFTESCETIENSTCLYSDTENKYDSVVAGFWWSIVTMSTVGYGDYVPKTGLGKLVGCLCALTGILVIALPFPLIITNFNKFLRFGATKNHKFSTIQNGLNKNDLTYVPDYEGVAYRFFEMEEDHQTRSS